MTSFGLYDKRRYNCNYIDALLQDNFVDIIYIDNFIKLIKNFYGKMIKYKSCSYANIIYIRVQSTQNSIRILYFDSVRLVYIKT